MRRTTRLMGQAARTAGRTAIIAGTAGAVLGRGQAPAPQAAPPAAAPPAEAAAPQPAAAQASAGDDLVSRIRQLADLRTAGILTDEEFAAAKKKLLA